MSKHITALIFIFICTTIGWTVLGKVTADRTSAQDRKLKAAVGELWGSKQTQHAPRLYLDTSLQYDPDSPDSGHDFVSVYSDNDKTPIPLDKTDINVNLNLEPRKKGLLWYATYRVSFEGEYVVSNKGDEPANYILDYQFPSRGGIYDNFKFVLDGKEGGSLGTTQGKIQRRFQLAPGESKTIEIAYNTQGMDEWWYRFGWDVAEMRDFKLTMQTDFADIDFPDKAISPTQMEESGDGWKLTWEYDNLISSVQIGMVMPRKLNPGPYVSRVSFFAPVSLFFFFFVMFLITTIKKINIHPMNYFFIAAAFFSYHILLAYLVDHIDVHIATTISSAVSIFLVISYMRLVAGLKFALVEVGLTQFVYLLLFSYAFYLEGYTGLTITILSILTLFVVMQFTGRINWEEKFKPSLRPSLSSEEA